MSHWERWCLWGKGQVKEMCLEMLPERCNWSGPNGQTARACSQEKGCKSEMLLNLHWSWLQGPTKSFLSLISVNGMGVMGQAYSEDKQAAFHKECCRSTNWSWTLFYILLVTNERNEAVENCEYMKVTLSQCGPVNSEHEVWWGQSLQYLTMVNCNNQDG